MHGQHTILIKIINECNDKGLSKKSICFFADVTLVSADAVAKEDDAAEDEVEYVSEDEVDKMPKVKDEEVEVAVDAEVEVSG